MSSFWKANSVGCLSGISKNYRYLNFSCKSFSAFVYVIYYPITWTFDRVRKGNAEICLTDCQSITLTGVNCCMCWSASRPWPVLLWKLLLCCRLAWRQMWIPVWHQPMGKQAEMHISRWENLQQQRSVNPLQSQYTVPFLIVYVILWLLIEGL